MGVPVPRDVVRRAVIDALGMPSMVLLASMTGFGSLARESALSLEVALLATAGIWGLPGQIALAELYAAGGDIVAVVMAVSLANARFLPMAVSFMPLLQAGLARRSWLYALVQLISVNTWAAGLRVCPGLPGPERRRYFAVFGALCMTSALLGTAAGYLAAGALPRPVRFGLVFLNPVFFALIFADARDRAAVLALLIGALAGPLLHLVSPDWGVLASGMIAGSAAFWLARALPAGQRGS
jgi:predicted branched-subunit amino acid permease